MRALLHGIDRLALWGAWLACALILAILGLILAEVTARKVFGFGIDFAWEYASYLLGISFLIGSGHVLRAGFHVRVQLALQSLAPQRARYLELAASAFACLAASYFAFALLRLAVNSYLDQTRSFLPSNTLLWPFQTLMALGAVILALQFLARLIRLWYREPVELAADDAPLIRSE